MNFIYVNSFFEFSTVSTILIILLNIFILFYIMGSKTKNFRIYGSDAEMRPISKLINSLHFTTIIIHNISI